MTRKPAVAGLFYPSNRIELTNQIEEMLETAAPQIEETDSSVKGVIVPHAGYVYSGLTAAFAFASLRNNAYDTILLIGPSHREYFRGISIYPGDAYCTPLGDAHIDDDTRRILCDGAGDIIISEQGHGEEHSIEVQLPFLQFLYGEIKIVPIVMGDQRREFVEQLAAKIAPLFSAGKMLVVASTDLSHYYPYEHAVKLDQHIVQCVRAFDDDGLMLHLENRLVEACGGGPMVSAMKSVKRSGGTRSRILHYCNSGDVTGDKRTVVGYLAATLN